MVRQYCIAPDNSRALAVVLLMNNKEYLPLLGYNFSSMVEDSSVWQDNIV